MNPDLFLLLSNFLTFAPPEKGTTIAKHGVPPLDTTPTPAFGAPKGPVFRDIQNIIGQEMVDDSANTVPMEVVIANQKKEEDSCGDIVVVVVVGRFVELKSPVTCNKCPPLVDHYST